MSIKSHIPFHRQISGSLVFLYLSFLFIIGMASFLLYLRNVQVNELVNTQIPEIESKYQYSQLLLLNNKYVDALNESKSLNEFNDYFVQIKSNVDQISALSLISERKLNVLVSEIQEVEREVVKQITSNDPRNITLKQTSIVQLRLLTNVLIKQIENKKQKQTTLHNLITNYGASSYISAEYAIRYIEVTRLLRQLNKALLLIDEGILGFESLTLNNSVDSFTQIIKKIDLAISTWSSVLSSQSKDLITKNKIEDLQRLLNVEQRVIAKWHSHLRLSEEAFNRMRNVNQELQHLYSPNKQGLRLTSSNIIVPKFITQMVSKTPYELSAQHYYYGLIVLVTFSLLLVFFVLVRLRTKIQEYGDNTVNLCGSLLLDNKQDQGHYVETAEQLRIVGLIDQIKKPAHSEKQYQYLAHEQERDLVFINKHHNVAIWQYKPVTSYIDISSFICNLTNTSPLQINHWRQLLTRKTLSEVIVVAKGVRDSQITQCCKIKTKNSIELTLFIGFDGLTWFGTLSRNEHLEQLRNTVLTLKDKIKNSETHSVEKLSATTDKFSKMVLRTMLQSQWISLDVNGSSLPVYRQLTRMFDWCRQTNIVMQLQKNSRPSINADISFKDELHAIVFNAMSEAHLQRNQIYLQTDRSLLNFANIEHRLFHRMLLGVIRVVLADIFTAKMLLDLKVIDRDTGRQTIQFTLTVSPDKKLKKLPDLVDRLVNEDEPLAHSSGIILYLKSLMQYFNINQVVSELHDDGFKVKFTMPLVEQEIHPKEKTVKATSFKQVSIVFVGNCLFSQQVVKHCINAADGKVDAVNHVEELIQNYSAKTLELNPVKLIVVGDDIARRRLDDVKNYLRGIPDALQPKLFVMQSPMNTPYHKVGLYNQASMPLCQKSLQTKILELLASDLPNNELLKAEILSQFQYQPTKVEVLLAVSVPEEHQLLIRILQWLGLRVHVVSQSIAMTKHWQSGRYLLLMSEFTQSPFIMLSTGQNIRRGIFTFKDILFDTPTDNLLKATKYWQVSALPDVLDIKSLVTLLEPWLKAKAAVVASKAKVSDAYLKVPQSFDTFLSDNDKLDEEDKEYVNATKLFTTASNDLEKNNVLDMAKYALNQGSPELAAYMIDEYINDIDNAISTLEHALKSCTFEQMIEPSEVVLKLSDVMAANDLKDACEAFIALLNNKAKKDQLSKYANAIDTLRVQFKGLVEFTEAI